MTVVPGHNPAKFPLQFWWALGILYCPEPLCGITWCYETFCLFPLWKELRTACLGFLL